MNPKYLFTNVNNYAPSIHIKNKNTPLHKQSKNYHKFQQELVNNISHTQLYKENFTNNAASNGLNNNLTLDHTNFTNETKNVLSQSTLTNNDISNNNQLLSRYKSVLDQYQRQVQSSLNHLKNYVNSMDPSSNPYLGKNIQFSNGTIAYVTSMGVVKPYANNIYSSTAGKNGCPSTSPISVTIPWKNSFLTPNTVISTTPYLIAGTQMKAGQSCGNEGENIFVNKMLSETTTPTLNYEGCYNDSSSSPLTNYLTPLNTTDPSANQKYSFEDCQSSAMMNGYDYFGLQNVSATSNQGICSLSNDLSKAKGLGTSKDCKKLFNSDYYGGGINTNALYSLNPKGYKSLINNIYYVNPNAEVYSYPSQNIGLSKNYTTFSNFDTPNNAFANPSNGNLQSCQTTCDSSSNCAGFVYDNNSQTCFPKTNQMWPTGSGTAVSNANRNIYIKNKQLNSAPLGIQTSTQNVDSLTASNYGSVKGQVSENIENQLVPQEITNIYNNFLHIQNLENELDQLAIQLEQNNIIISNKYKNIYNQSMNDKQSIGQMLNQFGDDIFDPKEMNSINNILSDSSIVLTQKNYSYIVWSIVAVTLVLVTMSVIRK